MDEQAFLEWLDSHDGRVKIEEIRAEWPEFFNDGYADNLCGVTVTLADDGSSLYPKRDIRQCVTMGGPLD